MSGQMTGWAWLWMTLLTLGWIALLGVVVYLAVRLARRDARASEPDVPPGRRV